MILIFTLCASLAGDPETKMCQSGQKQVGPQFCLFAGEFIESLYEGYVEESTGIRVESVEWRCINGFQA